MAIMKRNYGNDLLVHVIDNKSQQMPDQLVFRYPGQDWEIQGYSSVTWKQFADAINKTAFWLDSELGQASSLETVAYWGPNDLRYSLVLLAAMKSNRALFIPDGRVTTGGMDNLLKLTTCSVGITVEDQVVTRKQPGLRILTIPSVEYLLDSLGTSHYPYLKTFEEVKHQTAFIIHTSGTTGLPKPIYLTNAYISVVDTWNLLEEIHKPRGITYTSMARSCILNTCAPQWLAGILAMAALPAFIGCVTVILPADLTHPIDLSKVMKIARQNSVTGLFTPPHLIEELYRNPEGLSFLKQLEFVIYLGAQLDKSIGDYLCNFTKLSPLIGATESGPQPSLNPVDSRLWDTFDFVPETGHFFEKVTEELYELHFDRRSADHYSSFQGAFHTFRDLAKFATKELYSPRVDADGRTRWVFSGRKDDLTKLSWLAKFHATHIENTIAEHASVQSVFVGGEGRDVPFVIIEARPGHEIASARDREKMVDEIYNTVIEQANKNDVDEIHIPRQTVMLADPKRPFRRTLKMTVIRAEVEKDYKEDIESMYESWNKQGV